MGCVMLTHYRAEFLPVSNILRLSVDRLQLVGHSEMGSFGRGRGTGPQTFANPQIFEA